MDLNLE
jgi:hypothetical protein